MAVFLSSGGWAELLLEATEFPSQLSLSYGLDLRYLFIQRWVAILEEMGFPVLREPIPKFVKKDAVIFEDAANHHLATIHAKRFNAGSCLSYALEDYSYKALNYANKTEPLPKHFIAAGSPLSLGNVAIGVDAPPSGIHLCPPSELAVGYAAEISWGKKRSILAWLDVRYVREHLSPDLISNIDAIDSVFMQAHPMIINFHNEQSPKQRYVQYYAKGPYLKITEDEEHLLRKKLGYPVKGNTGVREKMLFDSSCLIFGTENVRRNYRGADMEGLELDVWIPGHKIAFEYQGEQHKKHIPLWHGENGLESQKKRDKDKQALCKKLGYKLMLFEPKDSLDFVSILQRLRQQWWV